MKSQETGDKGGREFEKVSGRLNVILDLAGFERKTGRYTRFAEYSGLTNATSKRWIEEDLIPRQSNRESVLDKLVIDIEKFSGLTLTKQILDDWWIEGEGDPLHLKSVVSSFDHKNARKMYELIDQIGDSESIEVRKLPVDTYNLVCQTAFSWSRATSTTIESKKFKNLIRSMIRLVN